MMSDDELHSRNYPLMPCPFCGCRAILYHAPKALEYWVGCWDCDASIAGHPTRETAIWSWNKRAKIYIDKSEGEISAFKPIEIWEKEKAYVKPRKPVDIDLRTLNEVSQDNWNEHRGKPQRYAPRPTGYRPFDRLLRPRKRQRPE